MKRFAHVVDLTREPSLPVRGRGLKLDPYSGRNGHIKSLPVRGRGLKQEDRDRRNRQRRSLPVRGRGLKQPTQQGLECCVRRSPCGGAD